MQHSTLDENGPLRSHRERCLVWSRLARCARCRCGTIGWPIIDRFFMTIPEACQLIMQAAAIGDDADTFVLDMGEPVKIRYPDERSC
ncbi:polysaccharide biosynthesis protein [Aromatoleum anaerobium]|uniref:Polysaccharide biosynthesis protein CapD-like domain-containing protein n=1 Tax=Aromatoleum anaerobium TaxID=182180 RepID=A0ABX1PP02_9RHOO|nr:polysaccharide biosynthesis protein [Aromatoleum anaerobium]